MKNELAFRIVIMIGVVVVLMAGIAIGMKIGAGDDFVASLIPGSIVLMGGMSIISMALRDRK